MIRRISSGGPWEDVAGCLSSLTATDTRMVHQ